MADFDDTEEVTLDGSAPQKAGLGGLVNVVGAVASLGLVIGIGVWGYKLVVRDVSGVPVVRALEGPMRVQPENPGGQPADHQGLAVNAVAAQGTAAAPADRLLLAPRPVSLTEDDITPGELRALKEQEEAAVARAEAAAAAAAEEKEQAAESTGDPTIDALVAQLVGRNADGAPADIVQPEPLDAVSADEMLKPEPAVLKGPGLPRSLRPAARPVSLSDAPVSRTPVTSAPVVTREVAADTLPAGTWLAQLGAFDSPEVARTAWDKLHDRFAEYLGDKSRVIQQASSGGRNFYRLRAMGFDDINDARRFCSMLVAENADCIPVATR
jgi:hypothetical protein